MMPSLVGASTVGGPHLDYTSDAILNELWRQLPSAHSRRPSRGSSGQRTGTAMRVSKPRSANNSPRSSIPQARTALAGNGPHGLPGRFQLPLMEPPCFPAPAPEPLLDATNDPWKRSTRPVSWHPSSHYPAQPLPQHQQLSAHYPVPSYNESELYPSYLEMPPTPAAYSGYTSPASAFSPLSLPCSSNELQYQDPPGLLPGDWPLSTPSVPTLELAMNSSASSTGPPSTQLPQPIAPVRSTLDWNAFAAQGFDRRMAPPTPENVAYQPQQSKMKLDCEELVPYEQLAENDTDGEILYGMGLYDAPESKVVDERWHFCRPNLALLLGGASESPKPMGKGLKLEDAWEPPASDDEEDEDSSEESE